MPLRYARVEAAARPAGVRSTGSFSGAEGELNYTQPAVSKIIASLEREIGAVLVDRETRPIRLTDAGEALAATPTTSSSTCSRPRRRCMRSRISIRARSAQARFECRGGVLRRGVRELRHQHAGIRVSISEGMPSTLVDRLRGGDLDLAVIFDFPEVGEDRGEGFEVHHLLDDPFDVVLPVGHRLAGSQNVAYADLADEDWVLPDFGSNSTTMKLIGWGCAAAGFEPRIRFRVNDCNMTLAMVSAGEGISLLPRLILPRDHGGIRTVALAPQAPTHGGQIAGPLPDAGDGALPRAARFRGGALRTTVAVTGTAERWCSGPTTASVPNRRPELVWRLIGSPRADRCSCTRREPAPLCPGRHVGSELARSPDSRFGEKRLRRSARCPRSGVFQPMPPRVLPVAIGELG